MKTTKVGGDERGDDGGKKIERRKRHLLVDTLGLLVAVVVTGANADDGTVSPSDFPRLQTIFGDNKYLDEWPKNEHPQWSLKVKIRPEGRPGFASVRKCWVMERSNA